VNLGTFQEPLQPRLLTDMDYSLKSHMHQSAHLKPKQMQPYLVGTLAPTALFLLKSYPIARHCEAQL
jgi:hypothetical protein